MSCPNLRFEMGQTPPPPFGTRLKMFYYFSFACWLLPSPFFFSWKKGRLFFLLLGKEKTIPSASFSLFFFSPSNYARARLFARMRSYSNTQERERKRKETRCDYIRNCPFVVCAVFPPFFSLHYPQTKKSNLARPFLSHIVWHQQCDVISNSTHTTYMEYIKKSGQCHTHTKIYTTTVRKAKWLTKLLHHPSLRTECNPRIRHGRAKTERWRYLTWMLLSMNGLGRSRSNASRDGHPDCRRILVKRLVTLQESQ